MIAIIAFYVNTLLERKKKTTKIWATYTVENELTNESE